MLKSEMYLYDTHKNNTNYESVLSLIKSKHETMHINECDMN